VRVIFDVVLWVESATLVAVIWTTCVALTVAGAVYSPLFTVPILGFNDQVTAVFELPLTFAVNCFDSPAVSEELLGLILMLTFDGGGGGGVVTVGVIAGPRRMVALADLVGSARLVARMVTSESEPTEPGAVYRPFTMEPTPCVIDHITCVFELPETEALNCAVCPAYR
jgi:hypothetical protein